LIMLGFDIGYFVIVFLLNSIASFLIKSQSLSMIKGVLFEITVITIIALYALLVIFIYSIFKLLIIKILFMKKADLTGLKKFYLMNLLLVGIVTALLMIWSLLALTSIKPTQITIFFLIFFIPMGFFYYPFFNLSQYHYLKTKRIVASIKYAIDFTFKNIRKYIFIYIYDIIYLLLFLILYFLVGFMFQSWIFNNKVIFTTITQFVFSFLMLLLLNFNRIYLKVIE
jgi:hypothetical protein